MARISYDNHTYAYGVPLYIAGHLSSKSGGHIYFLRDLYYAGSGRVGTSVHTISSKKCAGITFVCHQTGAFISSWLGGVFIDNMGNYELIWMIDIVLCTFAALVSFRISFKDN